MADRNIELESGTWRWSITRRTRGKGPSVTGFYRPQGEVDPDRGDEGSVDGDLPVLLLEDPEDNEHWMSATLSAEVREESLVEDEVRTLARAPDRRQLPAPDGRHWRVERVDEPEAVREHQDVERSSEHIRISRDGGPPRFLQLPEGISLGMLEREELLALLEGRARR